MNLKLHRSRRVPTGRSVVEFGGSIYIVAEKSHSQSELVRCAMVGDESDHRIKIVDPLDIQNGTDLLCNVFASRPLQLTSRDVGWHVDAATGCLYGELSDRTLIAELPFDIKPPKKRRAKKMDLGEEALDEPFATDGGNSANGADEHEPAHDDDDAASDDYDDDDDDKESAESEPESDKPASCVDSAPEDDVIEEDEEKDHAPSMPSTPSVGQSNPKYAAWANRCREGWV